MSANQGLLGAKTKLSLGLRSWELKWLHLRTLSFVPKKVPFPLTQILQALPVQKPRQFLLQTCIGTRDKLVLTRADYSMPALASL